MSERPSNSSFLIRDSIANFLRIGSLMAIAVGLFAMASGGSMVYLNLTAQLELERADRAAAQQADRIAAELAEIQTSLRDASVVDAARSASASASGSNLSLRDALAERGVVNILDVRVLPGRVDEVAVGEDIDLGFAATELVIEAIREGRAGIRVLEPGTPAESLAFAQNMPGDSGVLLLRLTVSVVTSLLQGDDLLDFVALAQRTDRGQTVLSVNGRSVAARIREIPINDSSLVLQWSRAVVDAPLDNRAAIILGCSGVIALMIGLLLRRRTRLARYLGGASQPAPAEAPRRPATTKSRRGAGASARRPAPKTAAFDHDETGGPSKGTQPPEDEPPTVVTPSPDLPEWLRDDVDAGLDELGPDDGSLDATQPGLNAPFPDPGSDDDDELLEDLDAYQGIDPSLFRPDGIYGRAGRELAVPDMVVLGQAIGSQAVEQGLRRICIAHDGRESGSELLEGLARGLSVVGIDVIELGAVPAPVAWFAAMRMQQAGAVVVTGGNHPEDVNGLEIVFDGLWLGREERRTLLDRIRNREFATGAGERSTADEAAAYCEQLSAKERPQRSLRLVLDCGNAVNAALAPKLFESLGVDVIPHNADPETRAEQVPDFDSTERGQDLQLCVDNFAAHLGIAFDRNGSRLRVFGPDGRELRPAILASLLAGDLAGQGETVSVIATGKALSDRLAGLEGVEVTSFDGDVRELQRSMREVGAALAVSGDGSVCAGEWHGLPDAFHAAAWLLAVLAADKRAVFEILGRL